MLVDLHESLCEVSAIFVGSVGNVSDIMGQWNLASFGAERLKRRQCMQVAFFALHDPGAGRKSVLTNTKGSEDEMPTNIRNVSIEVCAFFKKTFPRSPHLCLFPVNNNFQQHMNSAEKCHKSVVSHILQNCEELSYHL